MFSGDFLEFYIYIFNRAKLFLFQIVILGVLNYVADLWLLCIVSITIQVC